LPLAEFSYNNSYHSSIRRAPFEALYRRKCRLTALLCSPRIASIWVDLVSQSTINQIVSCPLLDLDDIVIKSMAFLSHFHSEYVPESDLEAYPEEDDDEDPEEDPVDYPVDVGDDGDDEEGSSEDDEDDDMDIEADEKEEE
nr:putative reverse transcriptase domain-containing protein [Tanacetum cinerariifolium]